MEQTGGEEEDVSNYWMTLRKQDVTGNLKLSFCGELALEKPMNLSYDRLKNE